MLTCDWAAALTHYDCRPVQAVAGGLALEIGTPFSLGDGCAIVLYAVDQGNHVLFSDNGDTLAHLSGMGLDVWHAGRQKVLRERAGLHGLSLDSAGDFRCLARREQAPHAFARAITGLLAVADWAAVATDTAQPEHDLAAEAEPYIVARNPELILRRRPVVRGASSTDWQFHFQHGRDLIDVIGPSPQGTGGAMRKAADVANSPFVESMSPLIVVDDRQDHNRAMQEISILGAVTRAMPFSRLMNGARH